MEKIEVRECLDELFKLRPDPDKEVRECLKELNMIQLNREIDNVSDKLEKREINH